MRGGIWLLTSGAYIEQELAAEFGQMPPSFLPLGTRRLYDFQLERIGCERPVYLTLPETYDVPSEDLARLRDLGATPLAVPEGLSLGESVIFALNLIGGADQPVRLLHGDTLIDEMPPPDMDRIGIATTGESYSWAEVELDGDRITRLETTAAGQASERHRPIACGYFAFAHSTGLVRSITRARGSFVGGILDYAKTEALYAARIPIWYDFGHVQTFFRSRQLVTSARHFNSLVIDGRTARKSSSDNAKIRAEAAWLGSVPPPLRIYVARLVDAGEDDHGKAFYETEYGYLPTLSELFVFGTLGSAVWSPVLRSCTEFLNVCTTLDSAEAADPLLHELAVAKTISRLERFAGETGFNIEGMLRYDGHPLPSLMQIAEDVASMIDFNSGRRAHVMHGDFCFSNILYDSRVQRVRVIDPRGYIQTDRPTTSGDVRYDLAKFAHSVVGRYDQIIAGRYHLNTPDNSRFSIEFEQAPHHAWLEKELGDLSVAGIRASGREVGALTVCLFLSMLPLHSDRPDRQRAFVANALRLYARLEATAE